MKKHNYFITNEAVKYWKKEAKSGRLHVARSGDKTYIVNSYSAFVIPANPLLYENLVQPATLRPGPEDGKSQIWKNGEYYEEPATETVRMVENILSENTDTVNRTPFTMDVETGVIRIYKLASGALAGINVKYDAMVDFSFGHTAVMANPKAPAVFRSGDFTALLLPVYKPELETWARALTGGESK